MKKQEVINESKQSIKIVKASLADWGEGDIILRGVVDPASLPALKVAGYQRGVQPRNHIRKIMKGFQTTGGVPDIELGMRGHSFTEADGDFFLHDDVFIIDGLQRRTAAMEVLKGGQQPKLGVMIHFDTTELLERKRFEVLNTNRAKVASAVLIRNLAEENSAVQMLHQLNLDSSFVLYNRVCWDQRMKRGQVIQGQVLLKVIGYLHRRFASGITSTRYTEIAAGLDSLMKRIGRKTLRDNIKLFFEVLDEAFNIRGVEIASAAPHLKSGFLRAFARFLAEHQDFWEDTKLSISSDLKNKIAKFPINDPSYSHLCGATGAAQTQLLFCLIEHVNSGKRTRRLRKFDVPDFIRDDEEIVPKALLTSAAHSAMAHA